VTPDRGFRSRLVRNCSRVGLTDATIRFEDEDVVKVKVLPVYVTMLYNRGVIWRLTGVTQKRSRHSSRRLNCSELQRRTASDQ